MKTGLVEIAREAILQQVEEMIRADRRIIIDMIETTIVRYLQHNGRFKSEKIKSLHKMNRMDLCNL